jgi:hypothetical protein
MSENTPQYKPGDVANGHVLTEGGQWVPIGAAPAAPAATAVAPQAPAPAPAPVKKKHTVRNVLLSLMLVGILLVGGCFALVGMGVDAADKAIKKDANKPGGTDHPMTVVVGKPFQVDGFKYAAGWAVHNDALGDLDIKGLKVTNDRSSKDSALVEVKFWRGKEVVALADCTSNPIDVGTTVALSCLSTDKLPKSYDKVTINDTF